MGNWYQSDIKKVLQELDTDLEHGLSPEEAARRLKEYGPNELIDHGVKSPWAILWEQLTGIMVVILIISAVISILLGEYTDAIVILIIVVLNAVLGFTQEYRAEQTMAALKKMAVPHVRVRRGGHTLEVAAQELVPGDVVLLETGNSVPADGRLVENSNLRAQEAVLTGESEPVEKEVAPLHADNLTLGDRKNMVYMGTIITYGRGAAVVTGTGMNTELGRIASMIQSVGQEATPLQRRLEQLGRGLAIAALGIGAIVFALGLLRGEDFRLMFQTSISMAVAAVPEGLPAVVTIALALGAQRMLKRRSLIRKLPAVETLGSVTVICSDKTGTLTENRMTVTILDVAGNRIDLKERLKSFSPSVSNLDQSEPVVLEQDVVALLLTGGALCNDAVLEISPDEAGSYSTVGDPTEGALVVAAARGGLWKEALEKAFPRRAEVPFDSDRKRMTTIHQVHQEQIESPLAERWQKYPDFQTAHRVAFTKGAVDSLLEVSGQVWVNDHAEPLDGEWRERIQKANNQLAQSGMRVLGVAYRLLPSGEDVQNPDVSFEHDLTFVGMIGMIDPSRPEVKDAVKTAKTAGIRSIMITGDHPLTALHIAKELGISDNNAVMTGKELEEVSTEELKSIVAETSVFARVSPEHKLKIVQALQDTGHIVAMTGDGVNDAPALKKADIGVAMGITGTDVSKEAADMVLLDDTFATIVAAVEEGRRIYDNIRKFVKYTMTSNAGEIWVMLLAPFFGMPLPLTPLQILWVNLVTDGLPGLALTIEPAERNTMQRPPYHPKENIFGRGMGRDILWIGLLMGLISLGSGLIFWNANNPAWQTIIFTTITLSQMGNALATRSNRDLLVEIGPLSNKPLISAVLLTLVLQIAIIYVPFLQGVFKTTALSPVELAISLGLSLVVFLCVEFSKWI
ncbi:MAG: cation-translocating P-type ATPase, partial [Anaerolineaceae bacterium]|nr:cation-translocating P-type ATPase [Anaerolineaceae bacterium]